VDISLIVGIILILGFMLFFVGIGMRVFASMVSAGILGTYFLLDTMNMVPFIPFSSADKWSLAAIPLFVFMGAICLHGGISEGLYRGASILLGGLRGGLLHTNIVACAIFSSISGSTTATAVTIGSIALPELNKRKYSEKITIGSLAAGSILGSMIPPSTVFIIYGSMTNTSIGKLFFGGLIPGLILTALYMVTILIWVTFQPGSAPSTKRASITKILSGIKDLFPIMIISGVVLGGIYFGVFTPVEGGAVGCITAIIVSLANRRLTWKAMRNAAMITIKTTSFLMIIIVGSSVLANVLAGLRIPYSIAMWVANLNISPMSVLLSFCLMYLILGCIIESLPVLIMTLPVVFPVAVQLGFDRIWFGVIVTLLTQIAMITPPVGVSLYVIHGLREGKGKLEDVMIGTAPFLFAALLMVGIVILFPILSTWLPSLMVK